MKKISILLVVILIISLTPAMAVSATDYTPQAEALKQLGLFLGTDNGFELERVATRVESAAMTVRLLGKEDEAKQSNFAHPFTDVPAWASLYVGYLYHHSITAGVADNLFGSSQAATSAQYATFILRALGYDDSAGDFFWDKSIEKMVSLGVLTGTQSAEFSSGTGALRGDVAAISYFSLFANLKGTEIMLLDKLYTLDRAISIEQLKNASVIDSRLTMFSNVLGITKPYPKGEALTSEDIYTKVSDAVFRIDTKALTDIDYGYGSGFFITSDGIAVTNIHVIALMSSAVITTANGSKYPVEGILSLHPLADLAVIKIKGNDFSYLELGDPNLLRTAQRIYCVGSPHGFDNSISDGLVSNLKREYEEFTYIQISAPIAPGSSGGPLLNEYGQVVGVNTGGFEQGSVNLAVPISHLSEMYTFTKMHSVRYLQAHSHFNRWPLGEPTIEIDLNLNNNTPMQTIKNNTRLYGTISEANDVDYYTLEVENMAEIFISLASDELHSAGLRFEVSDPSGKVILNSRHYKGETFSIATGLGAAKGAYTIKIYVENSGENWTNVYYELFFFYYDSERNSKTTIEYFYEMMPLFEFEPNDDPEYANYLPDNFLYEATISTKDDVDYYSFTLTERQTYYAAIFTTHEKSVLRAEVFDADNKSVGTFRYSDGIEYFGETLPAGTYFIKVSVKDTKMKWDNEFYCIAGWVSK